MFVKRAFRFLPTLSLFHCCMAILLSTHAAAALKIESSAQLEEFVSQADHTIVLIHTPYALNLYAWAPTYVRLILALLIATYSLCVWTSLIAPYRVALLGYAHAQKSLGLAPTLVSKKHDIRSDHAWQVLRILPRVSASAPRDGTEHV